jgi:hypothetical protein
LVAVVGVAAVEVEAAVAVALGLVSVVEEVVVAVAVVVLPPAFTLRSGMRPWVTPGMGMRLVKSLP